MCATIREVVVLPLVPVTATTGTRGRSVVGPGPGSAARTVAGGPRPTSVVEVRAGQRVEHLGDRPAERLGAVAAAPRVGDHDLVDVVGRPDPHARAGWCRPRAAIWRTSRSTARAANRCRKPLPGCPGRALRSPTREAKRSATRSGASISRVRSSVSLIAARGK